MAYERVSRSYHCMCGKGRIINEWVEGDMWPHKNNSEDDWRFECPESESMYFIDEGSIIRKSDGIKMPLRFLPPVD